MHPLQKEEVFSKIPFFHIIYLCKYKFQFEILGTQSCGGQLEKECSKCDKNCNALYPGYPVRIPLIPGYNPVIPSSAGIPGNLYWGHNIFGGHTALFSRWPTIIYYLKTLTKRK